MDDKKLKIERTPQKGFVLYKKISNKWELYYSIAGQRQYKCNMCGYPLKIGEECKHHEGLNGLPTNFSIHFIGYYQTDLNANPLNELTKRILEMRTNNQYYIELIQLLNSLFETLKDKNEIKWGTWIPTSNVLLTRIAREFILQKQLFVFNPLEIIEFNDNVEKTSNLKHYVDEKYKLKSHSNKEIINNIKNNYGIVIDDLIHTGFTIGKIMTLLEHFEPKKISGIVIGRTSRGKHPAIIKYPNFP